MALSLSGYSLLGLTSSRSKARLCSGVACASCSKLACAPHRRTRFLVSVRVVLKRVGAGAIDRDVIPTRYRANTPKRLAALLAEAGFAPVTVSYVATLYRYAERKPFLAGLIRMIERSLPPRLRSTIVAWYRPA